MDRTDRAWRPLHWLCAATLAIAVGGLDGQIRAETSAARPVGFWEQTDDLLLRRAMTDSGMPSLTRVLLNARLTQALWPELETLARQAAPASAPERQLALIDTSRWQWSPIGDAQQAAPRWKQDLRGEPIAEQLSDHALWVAHGDWKASVRRVVVHDGIDQAIDSEGLVQTPQPPVLPATAPPAAVPVPVRVALRPAVERRGSLPAARLAAPQQTAAQPSTPPQTAQGEATVSLHLNQTDVRSVFEMLARGYGMNIMVAPGVEGTVTADVEGLTPDEALDGIVRLCDLVAQRKGNIVYVYSPDKVPLETRQLRMFPLDFALATSLEPAVQGLLSPIGTAYATQLDQADRHRTQEALVVIDTPAALAAVEQYILQADQAPRQVMIEAYVLEVELNDQRNHGVDLQGILRGDLEVGSQALATPIDSGANSLFYARLSGDRVRAVLDCLETTTDAKTLASPKVMVINGQEATMQVGQQLGFTVATVTQTSTIQDVRFMDTGVVLRVTPTISRDNRVLMRVKPEVSTGNINPDTLLPEEETRELETAVLLNDHQGIVVGGLIQETDSTVIRKLPWLGDLRYVGKVFQRREATRRRTEIIITLIPHIMDCDACADDWEQVEQSTTPLLHGPLHRNPRPWEPRLPDTGAEQCLPDVDHINHAMP
ncbi:type II secretion system protein GspD [Roseimaritima ulvae]|uniref:Type IV pilus biogenesis and competence protein PilQ n=1 Tax=Roseimaritima ulvae TaxID=980254 RepID=A0A5B9QLU4_9BACT|nr:type II secretion system protein GspD [Roseimaritima ulvae]QEG38999.1 Type IV pilus biogenesis and competence protein PilQ precursor [Roseimaritima ulvae]